MSCVRFLLFNIFPISLESTRSTSTNAKQAVSNLHSTQGEERADGKLSPSELSPDAANAPQPEAANDPVAAGAGDQERERARKMSKPNIKGSGKLEVPPGGAVNESSSFGDGMENAGPALNSKRNSFRQQYIKLPSNLPMRSAACRLL